jgi:hypothetical protein
MLQLATLALALTPSLQQPADDALVVYSGGADALFADPRDAGVLRVLAALDGRLDEESDEGAFVYDVLMQPFCMRVGGTSEEPRWQLTVQCASEADARSLAERANELVTDLDEVSGPFGAPTVGVKDSAFWVALGDWSPETFDFGASAFSVHYDSGRVAELFAPWVTDDDAWTVLRALNLVDGGASLFDLTFEGDTARAVKRRPVRAGDATLSNADLLRVPKSATIVGVLPFSPGGLLDWVDAFDPGTTDGLVDSVHAATEVHLRADLFDHLGPIGGFFTSSATGGSPMSGVLFFQARAPERVAASLERLIATFGEAVATHTFEHAGATCTSLTFPGLPIPAEPCFAVAGDALYVAANPYALREALDQLDAETSVLDHPRVAAAIAEGDRTAWRSFTFFDGPYYLERGYAAASQFAMLAENMARSEDGLGQDIAPLLPALSSLTRHAQPWVGWSRIQGNQVVHHTRFDRSLISNLVALSGSPVVQGSSVLAAVAIPKLMSSRLAANESAAIANLRMTASAEAQFQSARVVDMNEDGVGEYGFYGEMNATRGLRRPSGMEPFVDPPILSKSFTPQDDGAGRGVVVRSGYVFQVWLGAADTSGAVSGIAEPMSGRIDPSPVTSANYWCCYAWPLKAGQTGNRVFVINQDGEVHFLNQPGRYFGLAGSGGSTPAFDAAYARAGDLSSSLAEGESADGGRWVSMGSTRSQ